MTKYVDISNRQMPNLTQFQRTVLVRPSSQPRILLNSGVVGLVAGSLGISLGIWHNARPIINGIKYALGGLAIGLVFFTSNQILTGIIKKDRPLLQTYFSTNLSAGIITYTFILGYFMLRRPNNFAMNVSQAEKYILPVITLGLYEDVYITWKRKQILTHEFTKPIKTLAQLLKEEEERQARIAAGLPVEDNGIVRPKKDVVVDQKEFKLGFAKITFKKTVPEQP